MPSGETSQLSFESGTAPAPAIGQSTPAEPWSPGDTRPTPKSQTVHLNIVSDGATGIVEPAALGRAAASAPTRQLQGLASPIEAAKVADLKVELADGQSARATVRERAGSIEVKIVTSSSESAQRVSGEIDSMRQNLDSAGLKLSHSEVSYQQGNGGGRSDREYQRAPQTTGSGDHKETFTISEVVE